MLGGQYTPCPFGSSLNKVGLRFICLVCLADRLASDRGAIARTGLDRKHWHCVELDPQLQLHCHWLLRSPTGSTLGGQRPVLPLRPTEVETGSRRCLWHYSYVESPATSTNLERSLAMPEICTRICFHEWAHRSCVFMLHSLICVRLVSWSCLVYLWMPKWLWATWSRLWVNSCDLSSALGAPGDLGMALCEFLRFDCMPNRIRRQRAGLFTRLLELVLQVLRGLTLCAWGSGQNVLGSPSCSKPQDTSRRAHISI